MKYTDLKISHTAHPDNIIGTADSGQLDGERLDARVEWSNRPGMYAKKGVVLRIRGNPEKKKDGALDGEFELTGHDGEFPKLVQCNFKQKQ